MIEGKDTKNFINNELLVDSWEVSYTNNSDTGEDELKEKFVGEIPIGKTEEKKYLGFVLSNIGDNMASSTLL